MKIVVLDGHTLNPGDLSWSDLAALGELKVYDRTGLEVLQDRALGAEILLTNKVPIDGSLIEKLPKLRYVGVLATGYDIVDVSAATRHNIVVTNVPGYSTSSVVQMVFALLLEMTQQVGHYSRLVREEGRWCESPDFCFWDRPLRELTGLRLGLVGFGQIGRQVARVASAFGMQVQVHTAHPEKYRSWQETEGIVFLGLEELFAQSDVVSLHCPLSEDTAGLVNASLLHMMKRRALLINTARGPLLDEQAVASALNSGRLAGLGIDVLSSEPPSVDNPLLTAANVHVTPHVAWATEEARRRLLDIAVANIKSFLTGEVSNRVN
ncbi:glycerate dehydrogenase [Syntrophotalea acetylenivorans]|uniref:Glycerate dehydrogenase n=1 Tax=Syntrophotalea acetylenivorans TaxID=1842532 RepID=A0A1L3GL84_9BACT|nr:D-2-hydroxyacid dehydrogenase [Syntrophotalea acetylenivorans]APG26703.1 glycerate dehydrogenase [Syntrophotalea acetylenivorans]